MKDPVSSLDDELLATLLKMYYSFPETTIGPIDTRADDFDKKYKRYLTRKKIKMKSEKKSFDAIRQQLIEEAAKRFLKTNI